MSNSDHNNVVHLDTAAALPARIRFESDYWWLKYTGTREDLIAEGLATPDMFPTGRKRVKRAADKYSIDNKWEVWKRFGSLFELRLPAPEPTEARWEPELWKKHLYCRFQFRLGDMWYDVNSGAEKYQYGVATHQLADKDWHKVKALFDELLEVISQARVERANPPHLERVK